MNATTKDITRIMGHVEQQLDCWMWTRYTDRHGYGRTNIAGRSVGAHRAVYQFIVGPIPEGHDLHHLCEVPGCVNPEHLHPLTRADHNRIRYVSQTHCKHGHEFNEYNTYRRPTGGRACRKCTAARQRRYQAKKRTKP